MIHATGKGLFLLKQLPGDEQLGRIADAGETTARERQLQENSGAFKKSVIEYLRSCIKQGERETFPQEEAGRLLCGNPLREGKNDYYCTGYKQIPPCRFSVRKEIAGAKISLEDIQLLISGKPTGIKKCTSKNGKRFPAVFVLEKDGKPVFRFPEKAPRRPPKAGDGKE